MGAVSGAGAAAGGAACCAGGGVVSSAAFLAQAVSVHMAMSAQSRNLIIFAILI
jgi:hypothetical protein